MSLTPCLSTRLNPARAMLLPVVATLTMLGCARQALPEEQPAIETRPRQQAAEFRRVIDELTAAGDIAGAVEELRTMDEYLATLTETERQDFAFTWTEPSLGEWIYQTTAELARIGRARMEAGEHVDMPPPYSGSRRGS